MLYNYVTTAFRSIIRHKLYGFINIAGLATAFVCAIFIFLFVRDEFSWDRWIPGSAGLYRLSTTLNYPGRAPQQFPLTVFPLLGASKDRIPEIKAVAHIIPEDVTIGAGRNLFYEVAKVVDPNFFQVIQLPFAEGSPKTALSQPDSIVISQSAAKKYFGRADPVGQKLSVAGTRCSTPQAPCEAFSHPVVVTGVLLDVPNNTQLDADLFFPNTSAADELSLRAKENWLFLSGFGYVVLSSGSDPDKVARKINAVIDSSLDPRKTINLNLRGSDYERVHLTRFWDVHLSKERFGFDMKPAGSSETVYGFVAIALLILLVACFNFTNLSTARATLRAKEIALRKCVGATRGQLMLQFLGESTLLSMMSLVVALSLVEVLLPVYDRFLGRPIQFHYLADWRLLMGCIATALCAGLLSGAYPALVLSGFRPAASLRANISQQPGSGILRSTLVVFQFAVSIGLGIATAVVFSQINFERRMDLGFRHDGIVVIDSGWSLSRSGREGFAQAIAGHPSFGGVAFSTTVPFEKAVVASTHVRVPGNSQDFIVTPISADPQYPRLYEMQLLAGRLLSEKYGADRFGLSGAAANTGRNILINLAAAKLFGFGPDNAIGRTIILSDGSAVTIVGVLGDAQVDGAAQAVVPTVFSYNPDTATAISVGVRDGRLAEALGYIDSTWRSFAPANAMQRRILSQDFESLFDPLERQGAIFGMFVGIAIAIACLGLFGLAAFTAERRTREIGIRKVFGARTRDVVFLLLWQFSIPVLIANAIAWPLAWYYLHGWLQGFAHRIPLSPLYFLGAGLGALLIAWATIFAHAHRVARANPIQALRYE